MTQVMKVSKEGYDVLTTGNENLAFSSELASHNIYAVVTVVKASPLTTVTYSHNLGFVPKTWIFESLTDGDGDYYRRIPRQETGNDTDYYVTDADIVINTSDTAAKSFRVIIFTRSPNP